MTDLVMNGCFGTGCAGWEVWEAWEACGGWIPVVGGDAVPGRRGRSSGFLLLDWSVSYHKVMNIVFNCGVSRAKGES